MNKERVLVFIRGVYASGALTTFVGTTGMAAYNGELTTWRLIYPISMLSLSWPVALCVMADSYLTKESKSFRLNFPTTKLKD